MKAKKIWIATHPKEPANFEVSMSEPEYSQVWINTDCRSHDDEYCKYIEYVLIEVEGD